MIEGAQASQAAGRANPIFLEGKLLPLDAAVARALGLKEAEVVQGTVQSGPGGNLALLLRGRLIDLPQPSPWLAGQALSFKAFSTPGGGWNLQTLPNTLPNPAAAAPLAGSPVPAAAAGLGLAGLALPSLPMAVNDAGVLVSRVANLLFRPAGLPDLAQLFKPGVLDDLLQKLPRPDLQTQWRSLQLSMAQLTPQALQRAVAAGMGAEVWLARGIPPPADDPKQVLRRLLAALTASAGEEDEASISPIKRAMEEIDASRVQAVQAHAQQEVLLRMMLPFHDAEPVELVFRRAPRQGGETPPFTVNVHSRSQTLGELWLRTQLQGEKVELTMWALQADVVRQARARAPELAEQLGDAGLAMQGFQIHHGARPAEPADFRPSGRGMVVDVSA